ncbi:MAG TPA: GIY-YIG nuclease family protein [bacterium]|nr:GIY-YIG nuclease family protein [bacterium]
MPDKKKKARPWWVYILRCADGTFYTGMTVDVSRRLAEHNLSPLGAKYVRSRRPVSLVYTKKFPDRARATAEELRIKRLSRQQKSNMMLHRQKKGHLIDKEP